MSAEEYEETEYHAFKRPLLGAGDYREYINANIDEYDDKIPLAGQNSDRPPSGTPGRLFVSLEDSNIQLDTGGSWTTVGGIDDTTFTITAGTGLEGGGVVSLGGGTTLSLADDVGGNVNDDTNETITGDWTIDGNWTFNGNWLFDATTDVTSDTEFRWGADGGYSMFHDGTDNRFKCRYDLGGGSETQIFDFFDDGQLWVFDRITAEAEVNAQGGYQLQQDTEGNRAVLKIGGAGSIDDTSDIFMLTNRAGGPVQLAVTDGTAGSGETVAIDIQPAASPAPEFPNGATIGDDEIVSSSAGDYDIQKDGTDGAGVINFKTS